MSNVLFLKIKLKSLAAEAQIIRHHERKCWPGFPLRDELANHRRHDIREEARATHLAYGFLRGRRYRQIESSTNPKRTAAPWEKAERMVKKYGRLGQVDQFKEWMKEPAQEPASFATEVVAVV